MRITIERKYKKETYTIGKMYVDGVYFCDVVEDKDRGIDDSMPEFEIKAIKVYGKTAIPTGVYDLEWTFSTKFKRFLPEIKNVKGFSGIRIHSGNTAEDSFGCLIAGENKVKGGVVNSRVTCERLNNIIKNTIKKEKIKIEIK